MCMASKLGRLLTFLRRLLLTESHDPLITWSCEINWEIKDVLSSLPQCLWPPHWPGGDIQWRAPTHQITWYFSHVVSWGQKWNTLYLYFQLINDHQTLQVVTYYEGFAPTKSYDSLNKWSRKAMWKIKKKNLHYDNAYGQYPSQDGNILQGAPAHKVVWSLNHMVLWSHVTN